METLRTLRPTILLVLALLFCSRSRAQEPDGEDTVARIQTLIDRVPSWPMLGIAATADDENKARLNAQMIEECTFAIAQFSTADIRQAIVEYEASIKQKKRNTDCRKALYFLNKYLFDIPELLERESPEFSVVHFGWMEPLAKEPDPTKEPTKMLARWPWSADEHGQWHFRVEHRFLKYSGPPYNAVRHFDRLLATFGRRTVIRKDERPLDASGVKTDRSPEKSPQR